MSDTALVIMARYPEPGKTKTRWLGLLEMPRLPSSHQHSNPQLDRRFNGGDYDLNWAYTPAHVDYAAFLRTLAPEDDPQVHCFTQETRVRRAFALRVPVDVSARFLAYRPYSIGFTTYQPGNYQTGSGCSLMRRMSCWGLLGMVAII